MEPMPKRVEVSNVPGSCCSISYSCNCCCCRCAGHLPCRYPINSVPEPGQLLRRTESTSEEVIKSISSESVSLEPIESKSLGIGITEQATMEPGDLSVQVDNNVNSLTGEDKERACRSKHSMPIWPQHQSFDGYTSISLNPSDSLIQASKSPRPDDSLISPESDFSSKPPAEKATTEHICDCASPLVKPEQLSGLSINYSHSIAPRSLSDSNKPFNTSVRPSTNSPNMPSGLVTNPSTQRCSPAIQPDVRPLSSTTQHRYMSVKLEVENARKEDDEETHVVDCFGAAFSPVSSVQPSLRLQRLVVACA
ncbi:unnamed protein product, partial [Protopolystoma xenopodis]